METLIYSERAAKLFGFGVAYTNNGDIVHYTSRTRNIHWNKLYTWEDAIKVGEANYPYQFLESNFNFNSSLTK